MKKRPLCVLALFLTGILFLCTWQEAIPGKNVPERYLLFDNKEKAEVTGYIYNRETKNDKQFYYLCDLVWNSEKEIPSDIQIVVTIENEDICPIGSTVTVRGTIYQLEIPRNKGQFNSALYYRTMGIDYRMQGDTVEYLYGEPGFAEYLCRLREQYKENIYYYLPEKESGILTAMLWGDKSGLEDEVKELYQNGGILHILSISGLHVSLIGMAVYKLLRKCIGKYVPSALSGFVILFLYGMITGFGISTVRAVIMFGVMLGAEVLGRTYDMLSAISLSAILILLKQPLYLYHSGFQLSFGAVIALAAVEPVMEQVFELKKKSIKNLAGSFSIQLATFPILLSCYYCYPLYGMIINLFILPMVSLLATSGMIISLLGGIAFVDNVAAWLAYLILKFYELICSVFSYLPCTVLKFHKPAGERIALYYGVLVLLTFLLYKYGRKGKAKTKRNRPTRCGVVRGICGILCGLLPVILLYAPFQSTQITMVDVGQGDCFLVRSGNTAVLIDGGSSDISQVGKYRIEPYLQSEGVWQLDYVIVSHTDSDHMNGILWLLQEGKIKIECLIFPEPAENDENGWALQNAAVAKGVKVIYGRQGMALQQGEGTFTCLYPKQRTVEDKNEGSLIWRYEVGSFSMLFTGDAGTQAEEYLLEKKLCAPTTVLKVGHHGSKSATNEMFVEKIVPTIALISCGVDNSYGHPAEETLSTLEQAGCRVYNTQETGAVTIMVKDGKLEVNVFFRE